MATIERLPGRMICDRLRRDYGLQISHGGMIGLLTRMAAAGRPVDEELGHAVRASAVVNADETGWREHGQHSTVWSLSTPSSVVVYHGRRSNAASDGILGADFGGTIVADCYAAYDHFPGPKQRCRAHRVRELQTLQRDHAATPATVAWVEGVLVLSEQARSARPADEEGSAAGEGGESGGRDPESRSASGEQDTERYHSGQTGD
jgi:hypothetical protein